MIIIRLNWHPLREFSHRETKTNNSGTNMPAQISPLIQKYSLRIEAALRHAFIADLYSYLWSNDPKMALRVYEADADDMGFDIVLSLGRTTRHIQLKTIFEGSATKAMVLRDSLTTLTGGCVVVCVYRQTDLKIQHYSFLGFSTDIEPMNLSGFRNARTIRANALGVKKIRPDTRSVPHREFNTKLSISDVAYMMLGVEKRPDQMLGPALESYL